jgi:CARDB protein
MKRRLLIIAIVVLAAVMLSGCGKIVGLVFEPNLWIDGDVNVVEYDGQFVSLEFQIRNEGVWLSDVTFEVVFSPNDSFDDNDNVTVYEDWFDIGFNGDESFTIQRAYMDESDLAEGEYWVAVNVDPYGEVEESNERDNLKFANNQVFISAGGGGGGLGLDDFEPNNGFAEAPYFNKGSWHLANLHDDGDMDWYSVDSMMSMPLSIYTRPGPNGLNVDVMVEVFYVWDSTTPYWTMGPAIDNYIAIPMMPTIEQYRIHIFSPSGDTGEYEFRVEDNY